MEGNRGVRQSRDEILAFDASQSVLKVNAVVGQRKQEWTFLAETTHGQDTVSQVGVLGVGVDVSVFTLSRTLKFALHVRTSLDDVGRVVEEVEVRKGKG